MLCVGVCVCVCVCMRARASERACVRAPSSTFDASDPVSRKLGGFKSRSRYDRTLHFISMPILKRTSFSNAEFSL
jgi:hypothetical protein